MVSLIIRGLVYAFVSVAISLSGSVNDMPASSFISIATAQAPTESYGFIGYQTLKRICTCESGLTQYDENGEVLRGITNKQDIGICQINEYYHEKKINNLGIDIYTRVGNIKFAKYLYDTYGTTPWVWSKSCWKE